MKKRIMKLGWLSMAVLLVVGCNTSNNVITKRQHMKGYHVDLRLTKNKQAKEYEEEVAERQETHRLETEVVEVYQAELEQLYVNTNNDIHLPEEESESLFSTEESTITDEISLVTIEETESVTTEEEEPIEEQKKQKPQLLLDGEEFSVTALLSFIFACMVVAGVGASSNSYGYSSIGALAAIPALVLGAISTRKMEEQGKENYKNYWMGKVGKIAGLIGTIALAVAATILIIALFVIFALYGGI